MIFESTIFLHVLLISGDWNGLSNHVVDVTNVNLFKARLDSVWINQDVKYDLMAVLTGTGNRSKYEKYVKHSFYIVCYVDTGKEVFYNCVR